MSQNAWRHRNEHGRLLAAPNEALMRGMEKNGELSWSGHRVFQSSWFWSFQTGVFPK